MKKIYVSHPYGGLADNKKAVEDLLESLVNAEPDIAGSTLLSIGCDTKFISPIHVFGALYNVLDYIEGLNMCLTLLSKCDVLLLCGDWQNSKGCMAEYAYAKAKGIPTMYAGGKYD